MVQVEEIIHPVDKSPSIDIVNQLIQESFGKRYSGDFLERIYGDLFRTLMVSIFTNGVRLKRTHYSLALIARKDFMYTFNSSGEIIGRFESKDGSGLKDGSVLRVLPEYAEQAKSYAKSYENRFNRETRVILDSRADYSHTSDYTYEKVFLYESGFDIS